MKPRLSIFWFVYAAFIFYGCLIPFQYSGWEQLSTNIGKISWIPFVDPDGSRASIPDIVQNVLFFMPFGFLGFLCAERKSFQRIVLIGVWAFFLSTLVETLQLLTADRTTSPTDVVTNVTGGILGATIAWLVVSVTERLPNRWRENWMQRETFYLLVVATVVVLLSMTQPFDFSLDVSMLGGRVKSLLREPFQMGGAVRDEGILFLQFVLLGYAAQLFFAEVRRGYAARFAVSYSVLLAVGTEAMQLIISSRMPNLRDAIVVSCGAIVGVILCRTCHLKVTRPIGIGTMMASTTVAAAIHAMSPFQFRSTAQNFNWIPFLAYYERTSFVALSNFVESMLIYFPAGFVVQYLCQHKSVVVKIAVFALACSTLLEASQGYVEGRYPDVTDILGGVAGAFVGCWITQLNAQKKPRTNA